jgi:hypothetical protein
MNKRVLATLLLTFAISNVANSAISVQWSHTTGLFFNDSIVAGNQIPADFYHILIWSPTSAPAANYALPGTGIGANEFILFQGNAGILGGQFNYNAQAFTDLDVGGANINNGYLYSRIFQFNTVSAGNVYWESPAALVKGPNLVVYNPLTSPPSPTELTIHVSRDTAGPLLMDTANANFYQVIPEPSVMALMGLGGLLIAIRRRRMIA